MKKIVSLLLTLLMFLLFVTGCTTAAGKSDDSLSPQNDTTEAVTAEPTTNEPATEKPTEKSVDADSASSNTSEEVSETVSSVEYLLPDSDKKKLQESDLKPFGEKQLVLARNEIYARHGRKFNTDYIQEYFNMTHWYKGTIEPEDFSESVLNSVEKYNVKFIADYEENYSSKTSDKSNKNSKNSSSNSNTNNNNNYKNNNNYYYYDYYTPAPKVKNLCPRCNGAGHTPCTVCNGIGKLSHKEYSIDLAPGGGDGSYYVTEKCYSCNGKGTKHCTLCHGSGYV